MLSRLQRFFNAGSIIFISSLQQTSRADCWRESSLQFTLRSTVVAVLHFHLQSLAEMQIALRVGDFDPMFLELLPDCEVDLAFECGRIVQEDGGPHAQLKIDRTLAELHQSNTGCWRFQHTFGVCADFQ